MLILVNKHCLRLLAIGYKLFSMKDLVEYLAKAVVDHPQSIRVDERRGREGMVYYIETHPDDKGRIIGRQGRVIESIRTVVRSYAKGRVSVEVR